MDKEYKFYDTEAFIKNGETLINFYQHFIISTETLIYLEKMSTLYKDLLNKLKTYTNYEVWIYTKDKLDVLKNKHIEESKNYKELACAIDYDKKKHPDETIFITNKLSTYNIANLFFGEDSIKLC